MTVTAQNNTALLCAGIAVLGDAILGCCGGDFPILSCCGGDFCGFFGLGWTTGGRLEASGIEDNDVTLGGGGGCCLPTGDITFALSGTTTDCGSESGDFSSTQLIHEWHSFFEFYQ